MWKVNKVALRHYPALKTGDLSPTEPCACHCSRVNTWTEVTAAFFQPDPSNERAHSALYPLYSPSGTSACQPSALWLNTWTGARLPLFPLSAQCMGSEAQTRSLRPFWGRGLGALTYSSDLIMSDEGLGLSRSGNGSPNRQSTCLTSCDWDGTSGKAQWTTLENID